MSNSKKKTTPNWHRSPKSQNEKRSFESAKEQDVKVRGKRSPKHLGDSWDDKQIPSNFKKQNSKFKPKKDSIRTPEEDEQMKVEPPKVKDRKRSSGKVDGRTKEHVPKKGKGSYDRKKTLDENVDISKFIECVLLKKYAEANKYLHNVVESKLQKRIEQELATPLFQ